MDVITACIEDPAMLIFSNGTNPLLVLQDGLVPAAALTALRALLGRIHCTEASELVNN